MTSLRRKAHAVKRIASRRREQRPLRGERRPPEIRSHSRKFAPAPGIAPRNTPVYRCFRLTRPRGAVRYAIRLNRRPASRCDRKGREESERIDAEQGTPRAVRIAICVAATSGWTRNPFQRARDVRSCGRFVARRELVPRRSASSLQGLSTRSVEVPAWYPRHDAERRGTGAWYRRTRPFLIHSEACRRSRHSRRSRMRFIASSECAASRYGRSSARSGAR